MDQLDEQRLTNTKRQAQGRADNARVYIALYQSKQKWPAKIVTLSRALGLLIPAVLATTFTSSYLGLEAKDTIKLLAYIASLAQVVLGCVVSFLHLDDKVATYQRLVESFTTQREEFILVSESSEPNPGILHHIFRINDEKYIASLATSSRFSTKEEFDTLSGELDVKAAKRKAGLVADLAKANKG
jgi:hypothetical protein